MIGSAPLITTPPLLHVYPNHVAHTTWTLCSIIWSDSPPLCCTKEGKSNELVQTAKRAGMIIATTGQQGTQDRHHPLNQHLHFLPKPNSLPTKTVFSFSAFWQHREYDELVFYSVRPNDPTLFLPVGYCRLLLNFNLFLRMLSKP